MVDAIGMYNGLNFKKGAKELTYYDLDAAGGMHTEKSYYTLGIDSHYDKVRQQQPLPVDLFEKAFNRSSMSKVLGVKTEADTIIMGKPETDRNGGMQASSGYARNQLKGLAYDINKPIDLENIMPIANNFYQDSLNVLGNLR
jgi:hypothetical protein